MVSSNSCRRVGEASKIKVRCGEWDTESVSEQYEHQERAARNISTHPGFKPNDLYNDVAIILVESEFIIDHHVDTICLPNQVFF